MPLNRQDVLALLKKMNPEVAHLLGTDVQHGYNVTVDPSRTLTPGAAAQTSGLNIQVGKKYLAHTSRKDLRGALTHELYHSYAGGPLASTYGAGGDQEVRADAVRFALTGHSGGGWDPSRATRQYAANHFDSPNNQTGGGNGTQSGNGDNVGNSGTRGNGPGYGNQNRSSTRNRNTLRNNASKNSGKAPPPTLSPSQSYSYAEQLAGLQRKYAAAAALSKANIAAARGTFQSAHAAAKETRISETADAVNNALDRGLVGSSIDLGARAGAVTDAASQLEAARIARDQSIAGERSTLIGAQGDYYTGVGAVGAEKANALAEAAAQSFQEDQFDTMNQNFSDLKQAALQKLAALGRNRDGGPGGAGGGAGGGAASAAALIKAGTPNTLFGGAALADFYKRQNRAQGDGGLYGLGLGLPYTPRGAF